MMVKIFTDGGSRGNPGPAGVGAVLEIDGEKHKFSQFIGEMRTNNEAEYQALVFALKKTKALLGKSKIKNSQISCYSDSELMVRQLNHQYKIKEERIQKYFIEIWNLMLDFSSVEFAHIPREKNKEADSLANAAMDQASAKLF